MVSMLIVLLGKVMAIMGNDEKKKSDIGDVTRSIYDIKDKVEYAFKADTGLTEEIIREISAQKDEPD